MHRPERHGIFDKAVVVAGAHLDPNGQVLSAAKGEVLQTGAVSGIAG